MVSLDPLPVDDLMPRITTDCRERGGVVLVAPPGAGKTTRVPPALLDAGVAGEGVVLVLEPRRLAARAAAERVARERGGRVGDAVGYRVRFDSRVGPKTRIQFITEGVFLRQVQADPFLEGVAAVCFDEFHERSLDADLAIAMARRVREDARPDLVLVAMSATGDPEPLARYLDAPVIRSEGRTHPVEVVRLSRSDDRRLPAQVAAAVKRALTASPGDVLVFLPGVGEIRAAVQVLAEGGGDFEIHELHGSLALDRQAAALRRSPRRKVVLATNVAETSVTVEGVTAVVDTGLARRLENDPARGIDRLVLGRISRSSADQRAGRAGREAPGHCFRLWTEFEERALADHDEPEVARLDLAGPVLQLLAWGETDPQAFPWFEHPPAAHLDRAMELLGTLGAVRDGRITPTGRELAGLPVHPRLGRLLLEGRRRGLPRRAALAAALLAEKDPLPRGAANHASDSDLLDRVEALAQARKTGAVRHLLRTRDQLARLLGGSGDFEGDDQAFLRTVFAAFADRLARRRAPGSPRAVLRDGTGAKLAPDSAVLDAELFVAVELTGGGRKHADALVRKASAVKRSWVPEEDVTVETIVTFDEAAERVVPLIRIRVDQLVLEERPGAAVEPGRIGDALADAAASRLERALPLGSPAVRSFLARLDFLRRERPDLDLPQIDDDALRDLLPALCAGRRSFADLRAAPLLDFLNGQLTHQQRTALDREAPERLTVPSGSQIRLIYESDRPPVLAVRIQEMFGLPETPHLAGGKVPVLLHLLAPNHRPQQVTDDLGSFWANTYRVVRKELRARYPKHAWPENPLAAAPERRPKRQR